MKRFGFSINDTPQTNISISMPSMQICRLCTLPNQRRCSDSDVHQSPKPCKRPREESWNGTMAFISEIQEHKDSHVHSRIGVWQIASGLLGKDGFRTSGSPRAKATVPSEKETGLRKRDVPRDELRPCLFVSGVRGTHMSY